MIITNKQILQIDESIYNLTLKEFTNELCIEFPNWMMDSNFQEKYNTVLNLADYGQKMNLKLMDSLKKFTRLMIKYNQNIPLQPNIVSELKNTTQAEALRLESLYFNLACNRHHLITIEI